MLISLWLQNDFYMLYTLTNIWTIKLICNCIIRKGGVSLIINKELLKEFSANKSRFYLFDFHVHSLASYDVVDVANYKKLSSSEQALLKNVPSGVTSDPKKYEEYVIKEVPVSKYYELLLEHKNKVVQEQGISDGEDWAFIGITDHNVCDFATKLSKYSFQLENVKKNRLVILPGIELDISFEEPTKAQRVNIHSNLIFRPETESYEIYEAIKQASGTEWNFGSKLEISSLPNFIYKLRTNKSCPAICIAAHIWSSKGVQKETKKCILNYLDAAILRLDAETEKYEGAALSELQKKKDSLIKNRNAEDEISFEILDLLGKCGYDALQVRGKIDEPYYYQIHRYKEDFGRAVAIICSDAHKINSIFYGKNSYGDHTIVPYIKLNHISPQMSSNELFNEIRNKGLRYGETRISFVKPNQISCWIEGIEITTDADDASSFWLQTKESIPSEVESNKYYRLSLSRNLNCIIGGRGSGKSALIEAVAFLMQNEPFKENRNYNKDWYKRAKATLKGCKVKLCLRNLSDQTLSKKVMFICGYFDSNDKHPSLTYYDIDDKEILKGTVEIPSIEIYRIHDIEEAAEPSRLRTLFDKICGDEIRLLSIDINEILTKMIQYRNEMVKLASHIVDITNENSALREYARRKYIYETVNKEAIKKQYEMIDQANSALSTSTFAIAELCKLNNKVNINSISKEVEKIVAKIKSSIYNEDDEKDLKTYCIKLEELINKIETRRSQYNIIEILSQLEQSFKYVEDEFTIIRDEMTNEIIRLRNILIDQGIEKGSEDRQVKKGAFEEAQEVLQDYEDSLKEFKALYLKREEKAKELQDKCAKRSELRKETATSINNMLKRSLDQSIIQIQCDAQASEDRTQFKEWLKNDMLWNSTRYKDAKIQAILEKNEISPNALKFLFSSKKEPNIVSFIVDKPRACDGKISKEDILNLINSNKVYIQYEPEISEDTYGKEFFDSIPKRIKDGIISFNKNEYLLLDKILKLDEIILDDIPIVLLNDRPREMTVMKELDKLSPGQRCSAILPILLLTGNTPLIIDQPEDNLDNRLIKQVIVNVLASIKLNRQVIMATHNANLPVLGDAEQVVALRAIDDENCKMEAQGSLEDSTVVKQITDIMEGGREAFQFRQSIYQSYWDKGAELT